MRFFNTEGPVRPEKHYFVPHRLDWEEVFNLIEREKYFVLHAPRQSGKTTVIQEITGKINAMGKYNALYINIENAQAARDNTKEALITIIQKLRNAIHESLGDEEETLKVLDDFITHRAEATLNMLEIALATWAKYSRKPIVLFIDEIDSLIGDSLLSVLRQLRSGYISRPSSFPQSICLIGLRDVRDYTFNIKAKSLLLPNFSEQEVADLLAQHTQETGQVFEKDAISHTFYLTQGQPWLVNALAFEAAFVLQKDRSKSITKALIDQAKEILIKRRDTHLDSLIYILGEDCVRPLIDIIINGSTEALNLNADSVQYVRDLGLIKPNRMEIANPIYQEIIPRELIAITNR